MISAQTAFISGNDTICDNSSLDAQIKIDFSGIEPFTFVYAINGVNQPPTPQTFLNPYIINTSQTGIYTLISFSDANGFGSTSGSGLVTILESPTAIIHLESDTLSTINPTANFVSQSIGNVVSWDWNFGDNTVNMNTEDAVHIYDTTISLYQASLIVQASNGCADTTTRYIYVVNASDDESYWIYIPNSFTPNNDLVNDRFCLEFNSINEATFFFKLYNSLGDLMYQTNNSSDLECCKPLSCGWDGLHYKTNNKLTIGRYIYEIYYEEIKGWRHQEYGVVNLIR